MVERKRFPRWLMIVAGMVVVLFALWLWLDHAFRAPDVVPELQKMQSVAHAEAVTSETAATSTDSNESSTQSKRDTLIDCSTPAIATEQLSELIDNSFGAELTELVMSGALTWTDDHPMTLRENWSTKVGVDFPASYASYNDNMLKTAADNGDALAAAIFGAKQVKAVGYDMPRLEPDVVRDRLQAAEPYLIQGILGNISGTLQFFWRSAEIRAVKTRERDANFRTIGYTDREAVIESHARLLVMQAYGSLEERAMAHYMQAIPDGLPMARDEEELGEVRDLALALAQQFRGVNIERSAGERRVENAFVALLGVGIKQVTKLKAVQCVDGRALRDVLPEDAMENILHRYGFPL